MEKIRQENFKELIRSYIPPHGDKVDETIAEAILRRYQKWGGCLSCVYSRRYAPLLYNVEKPTIEQIRELWTQRTCVLGLSQSTCQKHLDFPSLSKET